VAGLSIAIGTAQVGHCFSALILQALNQVRVLSQPQPFPRTGYALLVRGTNDVLNHAALKANTERADMAAELETIVAEIEAILEASHREWRELATEKFSPTEREQLLLVLDDRSVQLLEFLERKWKLENEAELACP
jgi:hypothetical protein